MSFNTDKNCYSNFEHLEAGRLALMEINLQPGTAFKILGDNLAQHQVGGFKL